MDAALGAAREELGATEDDVRAAARSTPFHPALREVPPQNLDPRLVAMPLPAESSQPVARCMIREATPRPGRA